MRQWYTAICRVTSEHSALESVAIKEAEIGADSQCIGIAVDQSTA